MKWNSLELWIFPLCCVRAGGRRRARGSRAREREQWLSLLCPIPGGHGGAGGGPNLPAVSPGLCPEAGLVFCILSWGTAWHTYTLPAHAARDPFVLSRAWQNLSLCGWLLGTSHLGSLPETVTEWSQILQRSLCSLAVLRTKILPTREHLSAMTYHILKLTCVPSC